MRDPGERILCRAQLLQHLAALVVAVVRPHPVRVAIDGVDAAGKTTLADELVEPIERHGRPVIRASLDGFLRPRADRYRRGADSAEGYYHDSFDYATVRAALLVPLGPGGSRRYRGAAFDFRTDSPIDESPREAPRDAILLCDGVFACRPELNDCWDFRIFVEVDLAEAVRRGSRRAGGDPDAVAALQRRYWTRYVPGQRLYLEGVRPRGLADVVVENSDPAHTRLIRPACAE
jgi:uridine kinase